MDNYERVAKMMREAVEHPELTPEGSVEKEKTRTGQEKREGKRKPVVRQGDTHPRLSKNPPKSRLREWEEQQETREERFARWQKEQEQAKRADTKK